MRNRLQGVGAIPSMVAVAHAAEHGVEGAILSKSRSAYGAAALAPLPGLLKGSDLRRPKAGLCEWDLGLLPLASP